MGDFAASSVDLSITGNGILQSFYWLEREIDQT